MRTQSQPAQFSKGSWATVSEDGRRAREEEEVAGLGREVTGVPRSRQGICFAKNKAPGRKVIEQFVLAKQDPQTELQTE